MLTTAFALLFYFLPYLFAARAAKRREVSNKELLLLLASVFFLGPFGLLAISMTTRFSKYKGNEFRRKQIEYELPPLEKALKEKQTKLEKATSKRNIKELTGEIDTLTEKIESLKAEYRSLGGKFKDENIGSTIELEINPGKSRNKSKNEGQVLHIELSPEEKTQKQEKARAIYNDLKSSEGQSLSRSQSNGIKR